MIFEMLVEPENVERLKDNFYAEHPIDVFSLDIDGVDLHVATELFKDPGFRPKVVIVEYNGAVPLSRVRDATRRPSVARGRLFWRILRGMGELLCFAWPQAGQLLDTRQQHLFCAR
jgi:hypothetical protein